MLLIISALKDEIKPILRETEVLETITYRPAIIVRGLYLGKEILVAHTGVGAQKMERTARFCLKEYKPDASINIGYCGALVPELALSDAVIADSVIDEVSGEAIATTSNLSFLLDSKEPDGKIKTGNILTIDKVASTPHEKAFLGTKYGAVAVDMESFGLAKAATEAGVPFAVLRSVCDPMDMPLPDVSEFVSADGLVNPAGLVAKLVKHPHDIAKLPQLAFCAKKARETLMRLTNEIVKK